MVNGHSDQSNPNLILIRRDWNNNTVEIKINTNLILDLIILSNTLHAILSSNCYVLNIAL